MPPLPRELLPNLREGTPSRLLASREMATAGGKLVSRWLDRDINAAVNVARAAGLAVTACGAQVRPGVNPAQRGEAGTHPKPRRDAA